jgi:nucleoside-diphosphate-sugar epimerase
VGRTALVLGATGSVGRQACEAFADRGDAVVAVARRPAPHLPGYSFEALDIAATPAPQVAELVRDHGADVVVNAAGQWGPTEQEMRHSHNELVFRLLAGMALVPAPPRLVHLGSIHEYGPVRAGTAVDESLPPRPTNAYARAKLAGSRAVLAATRAGRADGVVLRCTNMYGPYPPDETFLAAVVRRLRAAGPGEPVELTVADARRDFVDVRDVAEAVALAAAVPLPRPEFEAGRRGFGPSGRVFNIGRGVAVDLRELLAAVVTASGHSGPVRLRPGPVQSKGGDWLLVDNARARAHLGWHPRRGLAESVRAMWESAPMAGSRA